MDEQNKDKKTPESTNLSWTRFAPVPAEPAAPAPKNLPPASLPPPTQGMARFAGVFAGGVIIGVLLTWGFTTATERRITAGPNATTTTQNNAASVGLAADTNNPTEVSFEVASPQSAGKTVAIAKVLVSKPTWVVVYEKGANGPGRALGAALFSPQKKSGTVTLLRGTVAGKTYLVGQHLDNGNNTFSLKTDPLVMSGGARLLLEFTAK